MMPTRRDFIKLTGLGGVVFASGLGCASDKSAQRAAGSPAPGAAPPGRDFYFLQLSDTHWGYKGPANPRADSTLKTTVATVLSLDSKPDFIIFTGDLTHTTDDPDLRRTRMKEFQAIVAPLGPGVRYIPGEHDASLDEGKAFHELFGDSHYAFDHEGIHFIALDNVSDASAVLGDAQLGWLAGDLAKQKKDAPIVVFAHRPLFDLAPDWDWATKDGSKALALLMPYPHVTVFYGHIHQENHQMTEHIAHHSARSLVFPLPAPHSVPKKGPVPWDEAHPFAGLGYRRIGATAGGSSYVVAEKSVTGEQVVKVSARRFNYMPETIVVARGVPVVLELSAEDRKHGFKSEGLKLRADVEPGKVTRVEFTPAAAGTYPFHCDVFCGDGHEDMGGKIVVR
jgi:3',5'-cyclic AMP phosphodiesterase CpdA